MVQKGNLDNHIAISEQPMLKQIKDSDESSEDGDYLDLTNKEEREDSKDDKNSKKESHNSSLNKLRPSSIEVHPVSPKLSLQDNQINKSIDSSVSKTHKSVVTGSANTKERMGSVNNRAGGGANSLPRTSAAGSTSWFGIPSPSKISINKKKVKFYPEMARVSKEDALLFQFLQKDYGDPFKGEVIDPDNMDY